MLDESIYLILFSCMCGVIVLCLGMSQILWRKQQNTPKGELHTSLGRRSLRFLKLIMGLMIFLVIITVAQFSPNLIEILNK